VEAYSQFVVGLDRKDAESFTNWELHDAYKIRGEECVALGVYGKFVAVDWN
jgi:hypothetical protein